MVTINPLPPPEITISPANPTVMTGGSQQLTASVQNGPQLVIWEVNGIYRRVRDVRHDHAFVVRLSHRLLYRSRINSQFRYGDYHSHAPNGPVRIWKHKRHNRCSACNAEYFSCHGQCAWRSDFAILRRGAKLKRPRDLAGKRREWRKCSRWNDHPVRNVHSHLFGAKRLQLPHGKRYSSTANGSSAIRIRGRNYRPAKHLHRRLFLEKRQRLDGAKSAGNDANAVKLKQHNGPNVQKIVRLCRRRPDICSHSTRPMSR